MTVLCILGAASCLAAGPRAAWLCSRVVAATYVSATGGDITNYTDGGISYRAHIFTNNGTLTVTSGGAVDALIVGGGACASNISALTRGGGGAGGDVVVSNITLAVTSYSVVVGLGGARAWNESTGGVSSVAGVVAQGGGGPSNICRIGSGGYWHSGGLHGQGSYGSKYSGGGVTGAGGAGGGGGAGGVGQLGETNGGNGGIGVTNNYSGVAVGYGGGGGGASAATAGIGIDGGANGNNVVVEAGIGAIANRGGGGGGARAVPNGAGGSGIVIIRYQRAP